MSAPGPKRVSCRSRQRLMSLPRHVQGVLGSHLVQARLRRDRSPLPSPTRLAQGSARRATLQGLLPRPARQHRPEAGEIEIHPLDPGLLEVPDALSRGPGHPRLDLLPVAQLAHIRSASCRPRRARQEHGVFRRPVADVQAALGLRAYRQVDVMTKPASIRPAVSASHAPPASCASMRVKVPKGLIIRRHSAEIAHPLAGFAAASVSLSVRHRRNSSGNTYPAVRLSQTQMKSASSANMTLS